MDCEDLLRYLPRDGLGKVVNMGVVAFKKQRIQIDEMRFRASKPLSFVSGNKIWFVDESGKPISNEKDAYIVLKNSILMFFRSICENSVYAYLDEIRKGFLTIRGGHRVGFVGRAICDNNNCIENFRDISSINVRIARQAIGSANVIMRDILNRNSIRNTLIISPPGVGKTTILRDITRQLSVNGFKVGVADDRGEISAMYKGIPQNDIGVNTDVIENAPKEAGITILLRTMSPKVIITDEIVSKEEVSAVCYARGSGCAIIATAHGQNFDEIQNKPVYKPLFENHVFDNIIMLRRERDLSHIETEVRRLE